MQLYIDARAGLAGEELLPALAHAGLDLQPLERMLRQSGLVEEFSLIPSSGRLGTGLRLALRCRKELSAPWLERLHALPMAKGPLDALCGALREAMERLEAAERAVFSLPAPTGPDIGRSAARPGSPSDPWAAPQSDRPPPPDQKLCAAVLLFSLFWACETYRLTAVSLGPLPWSGQSGAEGGPASPSPLAARFLRGKELAEAPNAPSMPVGVLGAFLLDSLVARYGSPQPLTRAPHGIISGLGVGYAAGADAGGAGSGETPGLRLLLLDGPATEERRHEWIYILESHIDHLSGEDLGRCFSVLPEAGALDVIWLPALMKKNRPGGVLRVLCQPEALDRVERAFYAHTHTLGIRRALAERTILPRREAAVETPEGTLRAKAYTINGEEFARPEYEALLELSRKTGRSLPELRLMAARLLAGE